MQTWIKDGITGRPAVIPRICMGKGRYRRRFLGRVDDASAEVSLYFGALIFGVVEGEGDDGRMVYLRGFLQS